MPMRLGWSSLASIAAAVALFVGDSVADPLDHWTRLSLSGAPSLRAVAYGNGHYVATGDGGTIYTSTNGFSWTACDSGSTGRLWSVTYGNGVFVTADFEGNGGSALTSSDATNWTSTPFATRRGLRHIIFAKGMFLAAQMDGGIGGGIGISQDGVHWSEQSTPYANLGCAYGNGMFLCAGVQSFTSLDATNWLETAFFWSFPNVLEIGSVAFGNGTFVGAAEYSGLQSTPFTSSDGVQWTPWPITGAQFTWGTLAFGHDTFVMVGERGSILTSTTGTNWATRVSGEFPDAHLINATYGAGRFVLVGWNGVVLVSDHYGPPIMKLSRSLGQTPSHLSIMAEKDRLCTIQATADFQTWTDLYHYTNSAEVLEFDDFKGTNRFGIYRVKTE
jgi:hypothetical protein